MTGKKSDDLHADYAGAGFDGRLAFGLKPALLVVDVVNAYLERDSPLFAGAEDVLQSNVRVVTAARRAKIPVIFTNVMYRPGGQDGGVFFRKVPALKVFEAGSRLGAFSPLLQPLADEWVITKQYPSAFFGTPLASALYADGIDTLMIMGFSTSGCVRASALDAVQNGFIPYVVRDACGDRDARVHDSNLFDMQAKMAEVVSESEALSLLQKVHQRGS